MKTIQRIPQPISTDKREFLYKQAISVSASQLRTFSTAEIQRYCRVLTRRIFRDSLKDLDTISVRSTPMQHCVTTSVVNSVLPLSVRMGILICSSTPTDAQRLLKNSYLRLGRLVIYTTPTLYMARLQSMSRVILIALLSSLKCIYTKNSDPSPSSVKSIFWILTDLIRLKAISLK